MERVEVATAEVATAVATEAEKEVGVKAVANGAV